jgi:hypothetical protein
MTLDLTDEQTAALTQELHDLVENARYPFSSRIRILRSIVGKIEPPSAVPTKPFPTPKPGDRPRGALDCHEATAPRVRSAGGPSMDARRRAA